MVRLLLPHPTPTRDPAQEGQDSDAVRCPLSRQLCPRGSVCWLTTRAPSFPGRPLTESTSLRFTFWETLAWPAARGPLYNTR